MCTRKYYVGRLRFADSLVLNDHGEALFFELVQIWQAGTNSLGTAVTLRLNDTRFAIPQNGTGDRSGAFAFCGNGAAHKRGSNSSRRLSRC